MNRTAQILLIIIVLELLVGFWITTEIDFPFLEYKSDALVSSLISNEAYDEITSGVTNFLWSKRSLDLISQAFVILAAIICCLAMLKVEGGKH